MVRGIARDVGAEVDKDVAFVAGVEVIGVDAGNGVAKAAVLLNAKPGTGNDQKTVVNFTMTMKLARFYKVVRV